MEFDNGGFSIREYVSHIRTVDIRKCWPFAGEITEDIIQSILPPLSVAKFRWWSHELASLLTKSPVSGDHDSDPHIRRKSKPCKKRSVVEIYAAPASKFELSRNEDDSEVLIGSKRKRPKDHVVQKTIKINNSGNRKFDNKINKSKEQAQEKVDCENCSFWNQENSDVMSLSSKMAGLSKVGGSEFQIPSIWKEKRNVCLVKSPDHAPQFEGYQSGNLSHLASIELCCLELNRLSLSSTEDQSSVIGNQVKVMSTSALMHLESRQQDMFQPVVSERYAQQKFDLSHLTSQERVKDALDLERKGHLAQPIQSLISTWSESPYRSGYSFSQADMHCGTWLYQSPIDP